MEALAVAGTLVQVVEGALLVAKESRNFYASYRSSRKDVEAAVNQYALLQKFLGEATSIRQQLLSGNALGK